MAGPVSDAVLRLAVLAVAAGARGLVCSPQEVAAVRSEVGPGITLVTPGVRPPGEASHDQARVATPQEALKSGADLLVIGRPITGAPDPGAAAAALATALRRRQPAAGGSPRSMRPSQRQRCGGKEHTPPRPPPHPGPLFSRHREPLRF